MKARVKTTGEVVEVKYSRQIGPDALYRDLVTGEHYMDFELSFLPEDGTPDYWTRLEHQYAGMAMQGLVTRGEVLGSSVQEIAREIAEISCEIAHALVEKLKEKEEKK